MVYRFVTKGTCEQKMLEVASRKLGLDTIVLGGTRPKAESNGAKSAHELSADELDSLLRFGAYHVLAKDDVSAAASDAAILVCILFLCFLSHAHNT